MTNNYDFFDKVLANRVELILKTLSKKGKEYSSSADRFANFKMMANIEGITPEKACLMLLDKHEVSVRMIVEDIMTKMVSVEMIEEKIGDWVCYLILLEGIIKERITPQVRNIICGLCNRIVPEDGHIHDAINAIT